MGKTKKRLLYISSGFVAAALALTWPEKPLPEFNSNLQPGCDANDRIGIVFTGADPRYREGIRLYAAGVIHKLLLSGIPKNKTVADLVAQFAPASFLCTGKALDLSRIESDYSYDTLDNARNSVNWIAQQKPCEALIITSKNHMPRSAELLRDASVAAGLKTPIFGVALDDHYKGTKKFLVERRDTALYRSYWVLEKIGLPMTTITRHASIAPRVNIQQAGLP